MLVAPGAIVVDDIDCVEVVGIFTVVIVAEIVVEGPLVAFSVVVVTELSLKLAGNTVVVVKGSESSFGGGLMTLISTQFATKIPKQNTKISIFILFPCQTFLNSSK